MTIQPTYDHTEFRERVRRALSRYEGAFEIAAGEPDKEPVAEAEDGRRELMHRTPQNESQDARIFEPSASRPTGYPDAPFVPHVRTLVVTRAERHDILIVNWMEPPDPERLIARLLESSRARGWSVAAIPEGTGGNGRIRLRLGEHRVRVIGSWGTPHPEVVWLMQYDEGGNGNGARRPTPRGYAPS